MTQEPQRERDSVPRFIGWALIVVGVLWMASAGVCTVAVIVQPGGGDNSGFAALIIVVGLVSIAAGFGVFMLGRWLARS
jgi:hypothetical protein